MKARIYLVLYILVFLSHSGGGGVGGGVGGSIGMKFVYCDMPRLRTTLYFAVDHKSLNGEMAKNKSLCGNGDSDGDGDNRSSRVQYIHEIGHKDNPHPGAYILL